MARCFEDTCSTTVSEVETLSGLAYAIDVNLDPDGSIVCTDGEGLGIEIDPAAGNLLSQSAAGLLALQVGGDLTGVSNDPYIGISASNFGGGSGGDNPVVTAVKSAANPLGRDAIAVVTGTLEWFYTVNEAITDSGTTQGLAADYFGYNAQMRGRVYVDATGTLASADLSLWNDISGIVKSAEGVQDKGDHQDFTVVSAVGSGGTVYFKADACYVGDDATGQRSNISFDVSQSSPPRGFRIASAKVIWIPA